MNLPRIYLAIDNCFASKRWTRPSEWMEIIKSLGLNYVEASADTECDPLYMGNEYLEAWSDEVKACSEKYGVRIANLYSGHGTYVTLGLAHTDINVRNRFLDGWLKPIVKTAGKLSAGLGFFCHAFPDSVLQDGSRYLEAERDLYDRFTELAAFAAENHYGPVGVEQMYTPHQIPWTLTGAERLLKQVYKHGHHPFYLTIDVGHQSGQKKFLHPSYDKLKKYLRLCRSGEKPWNIWLGPAGARELFEKALSESGHEDDSYIRQIESEMEKYPYLFAAYEDGNPYNWLQKFACYSPIIHLQQTSGYSSSHLPFTKEENEKGIIFGDNVLKAIYCAYKQKIGNEMPPRCKDIYLTIEVFAGTSDLNGDIIRKLKETVGYWRLFIPEDGLALDKLIDLGEMENA
jgi:sugar phosphate isomerase/epimerase